MGDTMTRDEVEAVIAKIEARADAREEGGASEWHEAEGMRIAVEMLREALAKPEATAEKPCPDCGGPVRVCGSEGCAR